MAYAIFWSIFGWTVSRRREWMLALLFCAMSFGAFSVLPPAATGGITILPRTLCAMALLATTLATPAGLTRAWASMVDPRRLGLLTAFMLVAVVISLFMPRLFAGHVTIMGLNSTQPELLQPSTTIYTQIIYLTSSYCVALALSLIGDTGDGRRAIANAIILGTLCAFVTGLLDVGTHGTNLLAPFRTATYRLLIVGEILGSSRIVGLMPEASAYGGLCMGLGTAAYFIGRVIPADRRWGKVARIVPFLALAMAALSTSSAAYLGLAMFFVVASLDWVIRFMRNKEQRDRRALFREFALFSTLLIVVGCIAAINTRIFAPAIDMIDLMVFHKSQSASFIERSNWNSVSLRALADTWWLGVGVGSTRSSSWPVALASGTGILGSLLMGAFLLRFLAASAGKGDDRTSRQILYGAKLSWLVVFIPGAVSSPSVDFGIMSAALFGMAAGIRPTDPSRISNDRRKPLSRRDIRRPLARSGA
ncbi:hypothetical protein [Sphingomonas crusticola]|uniref:hypothetical protein n=1 Tax=Sphingomonas crusticola TaxID=1697973 RepID=UPI000E2685E0|nr:hypothetical protein [Sphingomonas crusticola]